MSDPALHARASELFLELRNLPREERAAALSRSCAGDARLEAEVASLFAHDSADALPGATNGSESSGHASRSELDAPERIGPYRVVQRIGRGSSGHVFLAEQSVPIERRVAIKVVPLAALDAEHAARFEFERRVMERTEHPNIARILDAGRTDGGLPYLVMDYVEGPPITEYCARKKLGLVDRIWLFLDVADAVQHAHQRGVIHRDLKPGNILVSEVQGRAQPRVLDFGIAKSVAGVFPTETPPTLGLPLGTPSYMAPEQTGLQTVDIRADVYALGAILYELAAGRPPIEERAASSDDPLALLHRIRDEIPPPASRVRAQSGFAAPSDRVPPSYLADLDCILAKALEKSRERRYATVEALAEDLQRMLRREPIEAQTPTVRYRLTRFAQRNRVLVGAGFLVAAALVLGFAGLFLGLVQAKRERKDAIDQSESQREINRFLTDDLLAAASPDREGTESTVRDLLHRASEHIDERFPDRPLVAASIHQALGSAFAELGELDDADHHVEQALRLRRVFGGANSADTVRSEISAASLLARRQEYERAEGALRSAIERARAILGPDDADLYAVLNDLGITLATLGKLDEAVLVLEEALAGRTRLLDSHAREVLTTMSNLALAYDERGDSERSLELLLRALDTAQDQPDVPRFTLLGLENNIGATYQDLGRDLEAAPYLRRAAAIARDALGPDHPATITLQSNLAGLETKLGEPERAQELFRELVERGEKLLGANSPDTLAARHGYWEAVRMAGRCDEAAAGFEVLLGDVKAALGEEHLLAAQTAASLARTLLDAGRTAEAEPHAEWAEARLLALYGPEHPRSRSAHSIFETIRARRAQGE